MFRLAGIRSPLASLLGAQIGHDVSRNINSIQNRNATTKSKQRIGGAPCLVPIKSILKAKDSSNDVESTKHPPSSMSKRKTFMSLQYSPLTLKYIQTNGLGERRRPLREADPKATFLKAGSEKELKNFSILFAAAAKTPTSFLSNPEKLPEVALIGRSNVGKSRLLNAVCNTTSARVRDKPGLTQSINWYRAGQPLNAYMVDMPGYGFAYAKPEFKSTWQDLCIEFLRRSTVRELWILIDARHGLKVNDHQFLQLLQEKMLNVRKALIMTKCDLVGAQVLARQHQLTIQNSSKYGIRADRVFMCSASSGAGVLNLRGHLKHIVEPRARP